MNTQPAKLVAEGELVSIDTVSKWATIKIAKLLFKDTHYEAPAQPVARFDIRVAKLSSDTGLADMAQLKKGAKVVAISYAQQLDHIYTQPTDSAASILLKLPHNIPTDEIKIFTPETPSVVQDHTTPPSVLINWRSLIKRIGVICLIAFFFILAIPYLVWITLNGLLKFQKTARGKAFFQFYNLMFYLNQMGLKPTPNESLEQFSAELDQQFQTQFARFERLYQQMRYSPQMPPP